MSAKNCYAKSTKTDTTEVCFTVAQAESLLALINEQETKIELLKVDVWEVKQLARLDSIYMVDQLELVRARYKEQHESWFERALTHPIVWLTIGGYLGVQAAK